MPQPGSLTLKVFRQTFHADAYRAGLTAEVVSGQTGNSARISDRHYAGYRADELHAVPEAVLALRLRGRRRDDPAG